MQLHGQFARDIAERPQLINARRHAVQKPVARWRVVSAHQSQHPSHQHDEKPVQTSSNVVGIVDDRGIGNTALSVVSVLRRHLSVVAEAQTGEKIHENVGVLLV